MRTDIAPPQKTYRADYQPPAYQVAHVSLTFRLHPARTIVISELEITRSEGTSVESPLELDGVNLDLQSVEIDGEAVAPSDYEVTPTALILPDVPARFLLRITVAINPEANTALMGLYMSNGMMCTQCEAEGFRRITYFPDRPDVLSTYDVRIEAEEKLFPILLANGNPGKSGSLEEGYHFAEWSDPHPKPCYLFALVAGDLVQKSDSFKTMSGRAVMLKIFVQSHNEHKVDYALDALKRAMAWDEEVFGREYDLDIFMIVAVDHFNFGAMENKGLNIFNSACVLANEQTSTDQDFETIEGIVAHEYFHNWSGNRVTCRDWFQLCLKEGFTVFRDQEFSADMRERGVRRIKDVRQLQARQFPEDAGPLAHPVRPDHFITIDNFYTATVYEKGAELVRMMRTLLGPEKFRAATDYYFSKYDGTAATVDDFLGAMEKKGGLNLSHFARWYSDAGTPLVTIEEEWKKNTLQLTIHQRTAPTPGQDEKLPRHIPLKVAFIDKDGTVHGEQVLNIVEETQTISFENLTERPVVSANRGFSAPITLEQTLSTEEKLRLIRHDNDGFNRWATAWALQMDLLRHFAGDHLFEEASDVMEAYAKALLSLLQDDSLDPAFQAEMLQVPTHADIARSVTTIDPPAIIKARQTLRLALLKTLRVQLVATRAANTTRATFSPSAAQAGQRALRNACLSLLMADDGDAATELCLAQAAEATNMTDEAAAVVLMAASGRPEKDAVMNAFYQKWHADELVTNKWLSWQGLGGTAASIEELLTHEAFDLKNPNKVRALIGTMALGNLSAFHAKDGSGYRLFFTLIEKLDSINPQVAARLFGAIENWKRLESDRKSQIEALLKPLAQRQDLSDNLFEMVTRLAE